MRRYGRAGWVKEPSLPTRPPNASRHVLPAAVLASGGVKEFRDFSRAGKVAARAMGFLGSRHGVQLGGLPEVWAKPSQREYGAWDSRCRVSVEHVGARRLERLHTN